MVRVIVCGGRDYVDKEAVFYSLDQFHALHRVGLVISGLARGADTFAEEWAKSRGIAFQGYAALWNEKGRAAGPIRNWKMLEEGKPDWVIAFPGQRGTRHMIHIAQVRGIPVWEPIKG